MLGAAYGGVRVKQEFTQGMKNLMADTIRDVHTAVPGKIVTFDPDKVEATVQPTAKFRKPDGTQIDFPQIFEVPVFFPQAIKQKMTFTWHIEPGDEVTIFFLEQALDQWRTGAEAKTELRFDLQNAFCMTGLVPKPNKLVRRAADNESIIIQRGEGGEPEETFIELYDGKMEMQVQYSGNEIDTFHLMVDGREDTLAFTVKDTGGGVQHTTNINGNNGQVDVFTKGDINVETEKDLNIKVGGNMNITVAGNITTTAGGTIRENAAAIHHN